MNIVELRAHEYAYYYGQFEETNVIVKCSQIEFFMRDH